MLKLNSHSLLAMPNLPKRPVRKRFCGKEKDYELSG